ncbi:MAG: lysophospholipid acyltransferase family protein [Dermabacter sp.]|nr:lysophospholipid acyltransferase family protein [Dermabacter sp.]
MSAFHDPALYKSRWRAYGRGFLQRGLFRTLVRRTVTQHIDVDPGVAALKGAFLLVANHSSHLDAPMLAQGLPFAQGKYLSTGVAREYFFDVWYRRIFVRSMFNAFPIDRDGSKRHAGISRTLLKAGVPVLVFPEGTRSKTGTMGTFKPGAAALAVAEGVPVVPAALVGAHEAMPKGRNWPVPGRPPVGVIFGAPLYPGEGESALALNTRIREAVVDLYDSNKARIMGGSDQHE